MAWFLFLQSLLFLAARAPVSQGWGKEGHYIDLQDRGGETCKITSPCMRDSQMTGAETPYSSVAGWADEVSQWRTCNVKSMTSGDKFASESVSLACDYAYKDVERNATLGDHYFFSRQSVVEKRIAQGGVRLAELLNYIFGKGGNKEILQSIAESILDDHLVRLVSLVLSG